MKKNDNIQNKRETFSSGLTIFFATLGSAVGLGNIWKFPYVVGMNGGGAFLVTYLVCVLLVGLPIMITEFYIGRKTRKNPVGAYKALNPKSSWKSIGFMGVASAFLIMFFYSCVAGWVYSYVFKAIKGDFANITTDTSAQIFGNTITGVIPPIAWQIAVMVLVSLILVLGVKKGIERITKTLMPVLFLLIIIIAIKSLTLPGAGDGLKFLFHVDFSKLSGGMFLTALGLAFFKLSIGVGCMTTYASYFTDDNNMIGTSAKVALSDTLVSLLAGIAIFPAVFTFNVAPGAGPGLLFMTIPLVFSKIPFGNILLVAFFILTAIASTTAMLSLVEVPVAYFVEEKGMSRKKAVIVSALIIIVVGILASLSADKGSFLGGVSIFGKTIFDLFDYLSSNILLPIIGLLMSIFIGYFVKKEDIKKELSNNGSLKIGKIIDMFYFVIRYITPLLLIVVFLNSIGIIKV
jgi:Na+-dependent transporters of the SNF family